MPLDALFRLAFAPAPALHGLNLATRSNSPAHSSIGTPSPARTGSDCLWAHGFRVFSSPFRGAFHLSLTVLVHYRSSRVFSLGGWSPQLPTEFHVLRGTQVPDHAALATFRLRGSHPLWPAFPDRSTTRRSVYARPSAAAPRTVLQPPVHNARRLDMDRVWARPRSLTTTWGISVDFFSSGY